ncbi:hypothetical protein B0H14DRAFT_2580102 [Mycena olivaceomarginata]|nr:hypothetical protein B0H14DRAFT_2580102 [Mycena olivaceomarginata]
MPGPVIIPMEVRYGSPDKISPERRQLRSKSRQDWFSAPKAWVWESGQGSGGTTISNTSPDKVYKDNPQWNPSEWIGCRHTIADVPHFVAVEAARALEIPIEIKSSLPPETLTPSEFFASSTLPPWDPDIDTTEISFLVGFDATHPSFNPSSPCDIQLLPLATVRQLRSTYGQAWLDGKTSIHDARTPGHVRFYPLWALSYIELALGISRYAHLPNGSILLRIPDKVALKHNVAEVSSTMALKYKELQKEKNRLVSVVTMLNTVQRRGQPNANIADIEEEDDVDM